MCRTIYVIIICFLLLGSIPVKSQQAYPACDIDRAMEICSSLPLDAIEGIWIYPEDNVTVLILRENNPNSSSLPIYNISVVQSDDCRLHPGEIIGTISATPEAKKYQITLFTERNNDILQKSHSCLASLSKDEDALILKENKSKKFNLRFNLNFTRLLPSFWKIVHLSASSGGKSDSSNPPVGMVKIYPSYDGNGSSRRQPRYL